MEEVYSISVTPQRFNLLLLGLMACVAVVLAGVGLYGVTAYMVQQQTREIGIRMALGAEPRDVLGAILLHGAKLAVTGMIIGIAAALSLNRLMKSLLFSVSAADPLTYTVAATFLCFVALAACYFPARKAAHLDPMIALRDQ
jgi:ABC-type antimicrobial peptide transport system permease subunit